MIPRTALMERLEGLPPGKLIYIHAPAGYGKSVAAHLWATQKRAHAIVSLDEYDNNLASFCRRFCNALQEIARENTLVREMARHPAFARAPDEYTAHAVAALPPGTDARLVVDDLHCIQNEAVLRLLPKLLARMPTGMGLMALSREKPAEGLSELVVEGNISVFTEEQLKFCGEEVMALYASRGVKLTKAQAKTICDVAGGWAMGVNAMLLSGEKAPGGKLLTSHLENFIRTQIWEKWDDEIRDFLLSTAAEDELTPALCAALTGREDCADLLERLVQNGAFLIRSGEDVYYFRGLFREFLRGLLKGREEFVRGQTHKAGLCYRSGGRYIKAVDAFLRCGDGEMLMVCINELAESAKNQFAIDELIPFFRSADVEPLLEKHPPLLTLRAWAAFLDGRPEEMEMYTELAYAKAPETLARYPEYAPQLFFHRSIDYRIPLRQLAGELAGAPGVLDTSASSGTVTEHMPLFHRSARDMSEFAGEDMAGEVEQLRQAIGGMFGAEANLMEKLLLGGLQYERGELTEAHKVALEAITALRDDYASETKFCAMVLYIHVLRALWRYDRAALMAADMDRMIEKDRAYFLTHNSNAYLCRCKLENGDAESAREWLDTYGVDPLSELDFFHLYGHFTTARAHIALGNYDKAIVVLAKIGEMCGRYRRPLDVIEAEVLMAIAFWKRKRGYQGEALGHLERAILTAHPYGYTQVFVNEGAELSTMLFKLQNRANRKNYTGELPGSFTRMIHIQATAHARHVEGLTGGQTPPRIKYTAQQKQVMRLLCAGYSYRQIAEAMDIKFSTVRSHIELIYKKLDVPNEMEAVQKIREQNLLDDG